MLLQSVVQRAATALSARRYIIKIAVHQGQDKVHRLVNGVLLSYPKDSPRVRPGVTRFPSLGLLDDLPRDLASQSFSRLLELRLERSLSIVHVPNENLIFFSLFYNRIRRLGKVFENFHRDTCHLAIFHFLYTYNS